MISKLLWFVLGGFVGVMIMALVSVNREETEVPEGYATPQRLVNKDE